MRNDADLEMNTYAEQYAVLQLPIGSSREQIHTQYRRLAKIFHPDRNPGMQDWCEGQLRRLNDAYQILTSRPDPAMYQEQSVPSQPQPVQGLWPSVSLERIRSATRGARAAQVIVVSVAIGLLFAFLAQPPRDQARAGTPTGGADMPHRTGDSAIVPPPDPGKDALAAQFSLMSKDVDETVAQAAMLVATVNSETWHVPNSNRVEKADQLEADELELVRLQSVARIDIQDLQTWTSADTRQSQITDIKMAIYQMQQQRALVSHELNGFPEE